MHLHDYGHLIFEKRPEIHPGEKKNPKSSTKGTGQTGIGACRRIKIYPYLSPHTKLYCKWIKYFNIKSGTLVKEKRGIALNSLAQEKTF